MSVVRLYLITRSVKVIDVNLRSEIFKLTIESFAFLSIFRFVVNIVIIAIVILHLLMQFSSIKTMEHSNLHVSLIAVPLPVCDPISYYNTFQVE